MLNDSDLVRLLKPWSFRRGRGLTTSGLTAWLGRGPGSGAQGANYQAGRSRAQTRPSAPVAVQHLLPSSVLCIIVRAEPGGTLEPCNCPLHWLQTAFPQSASCPCATAGATP